MSRIMQRGHDWTDEELDAVCLACRRINRGWGDAEALDRLREVIRQLANRLGLPEDAPAQAEKMIREEQAAAKAAKLPGPAADRATWTAMMATLIEAELDELVGLAATAGKGYARYGPLARRIALIHEMGERVGTIEAVNLAERLTDWRLGPQVFPWS